MVRFQLPPKGTLQPNNQDDPLPQYYKPLVGKIYSARLDIGLELLEPRYGKLLEVGYGSGYVYAPHTEEGVGGIDCLPESLQGTRFYEPKGEGFEAKLKARLEQLRALRDEVGKRRPT